MILAIDTSGQKIELCLYWPNNKSGYIFQSKSEQKSDNLLLNIQQILRKNKIKLEDLRAIVVNRGPGSFTGLRVGISVANALGFSLKIPVIGIKAGENILKIAEMGYKKLSKSRTAKIIVPFYGKE